VQSRDVRGVEKIVKIIAPQQTSCVLVLRFALSLQLETRSALFALSRKSQEEQYVVFTQRIIYN
jgi:hypothetical protein